MLNGTWVIEAIPPADAVKVCRQFLPTGTAVQLQVEGASRQAIEEGKEDELGGTLSLLPPLSLTLCETGLGASTGFGTNFCAQGRVDWDAGQPVPFTDAIFALSRWDAEEARDPDNFFYSDAGAKAGSRFAHLILKDKGVEWQLWMKNANEMMARCIATLPGRRNVRSFPMVWKRVAMPVPR